MVIASCFSPRSGIISHTNITTSTTNFKIMQLIRAKESPFLAQAAMDEAIDSLHALKNKYNEPSIQDPLRRLTVDQASQNIEEWAKNLYLAKRDRDDANSVSLNMDRKVILNLVYELVNLWNNVLDELGDEAADDFEDSIICIFEIRRIERILGFGVPMDRAQALYAMKVPTWSKYGMHWYSEYHFDNSSPYCNYGYSQDLSEKEREEWRDLLSDYPGFPTMNKRLFQLLYSEKLGLRRRHPNTFGRWCKPQAAEFVSILAK